MFADLRVKELMSITAEAAAEGQDEDHCIAGSVSGDAVSVTGVSGEQLDPSRLPPAQRQLFMRIQQKQHHRDDKPISEVTAKCTHLSVYCYLFCCDIIATSKNA